MTKMLLPEETARQSNRPFAFKASLSSNNYSYYKPDLFGVLSKLRKPATGFVVNLFNTLVSLS